MVKFKCRNDIVLFRMITEDVRGIAMPDKSMTAKVCIVEAIGPKVEDLQVGDRVFVAGKLGETCGAIPNSIDLYVTPQQYVYLIEIPQEEN